MKLSLNKITINELIEKLELFQNFEINKNSDFENDYKNWENKIIKFINKHILPENNDLNYFFQYYKYNVDSEKNKYSFYSSEHKIDKFEDCQIDIDNSKYKLNILINYLKISSFGKSVINNIKINSIEEKIDFILEKLKILFSDDYYSISKILDVNFIKYRTEEPEEIAENLFKRKYVIKYDGEYNKTDFVRITIKGSAYIERKLKSKNKKVKDENLNKKIDEVLLRLQKLGFGQEIIFNEIEELRELQTKLSKKSWAQLLKGKLVDLAIEKIVDVNTATFIYEFLTSSDFKLLK